MKKLILILSLIFAFGVSQAQNGKLMTFTPASNDSVVAAVTKYCTLSGPITGRWNGTIEVYLTRSLGTGDSTQVTIEGSMNNSTWYVLDLGTPVTSGVSVAYHPSVKFTTIVGTGGIILQPSWFIAPLYLRVKVQHYVAATSMKITRASLYIKR
jgi:hypothetical protein